MAIDSGHTRGIPTHRHFPIERMNALTDGVFAIVLTLLVLELKLPEKDESVLTLIANDWHVFLAWATTVAAQGTAACFQVLAHKNLDSFDRRFSLTDASRLAGV